MYNGSPQRYDWKLVGKKEIYVPYNAYRLQDGKLRYADLLKKNHINQDLARYELHRVWVVDSTLKTGVSHIYSRRTLYVDEDSWQILAVDCYDTRGQLYRVQEGHAMNYYNLPSLWDDLELVMDLSNGRYLALGLQSEEHGSYDFNIKRTIFLRKRAVANTQSKNSMRCRLLSSLNNLQKSSLRATSDDLWQNVHDGPIIWILRCRAWYLAYVIFQFRC